jgi:predicted nuclease of predicted toxin-antitoxin system
MRLYLDDDTAERSLSKLLSAAGYDVMLPSDAGSSGADDPIHLLNAIRGTQVLLTKNYRDFELLHELVLGSGGSHPGIVVIRQDNDRRDMSSAVIVDSLGRLVRSGIEIGNGYHTLNHFR